MKIFSQKKKSWIFKRNIKVIGGKSVHNNLKEYLLYKKIINKHYDFEYTY